MQRTKSAIRMMTIFFFISIISNAVVLFSFLGNVRAGEVTQREVSSFGSYMCWAIIISLVGMIFFTLALYNFIKDRKTMPREHESSVKAAFLFYLGGFFLGNLFRPIQIPLYSVGAVFLVRKVAGDVERKMLWAAAGLNILYGFSLYLLLFSVIEHKVDNLTLFALIGWLLAAITIAMSLFIITYRRISDNLSSRKERGPSGPRDYQIGDMRREDEGDKKPKGTRSYYPECPECGMRSIKVYKDGSAGCQRCDFATSEWVGEDEQR